MSTYSYERVTIDIPDDEVLTLPEGQRISSVLKHWRKDLETVSYSVLIERKQLPEVDT